MVHLKIGCRGSRLARTQTDQAGKYITENSAGTSFEKVVFTTTGDKIAGSLKMAGGKGLFVREVDAGLMAGSINLAIHCLKDMPGNTPVPTGTVIAGYLPREDFADIFISEKYSGINELPEGARIGTAAPRRVAQLSSLRPDLTFDLNYRGSIDTRISNLVAGKVDAIVLAAAGLNRASLSNAAWVRLDPEEFLPAIGQGTLALQCRTDDTDVFDVCRAANDAQTEYASIAERECLSALDGDCFSSIAGFCAKEDGRWRFIAAVFSGDGRHSVRRSLEALEHDGPVELGRRMASELLSGGAGEFIGKETRR